EIYEHKLFPSLDFYGYQAVLLPVEVFYAVEFRRPFERAVQPIIPAVIGAMQDRSLPAGLRNPRGCVMPAYIVEAPQLAIVSPQHDDRFANQIRGYELPGRFQLIHAPHHLPG